MTDLAFPQKQKSSLLVIIKPLKKSLCVDFSEFLSLSLMIEVSPLKKIKNSNS
jgi:hypothetical protein